MIIFVMLIVLGVAILSNTGHFIGFVIMMCGFVGVAVCWVSLKERVERLERSKYDEIKKNTPPRN